MAPTTTKATTVLSPLPLFQPRQRQQQQQQQEPGQQQKRSQRLPVAKVVVVLWVIILVLVVWSFVFANKFLRELGFSAYGNIIVAAPPPPQNDDDDDTSLRKQEIQKWLEREGDKNDSFCLGHQKYLTDTIRIFIGTYEQALNSTEFLVINLSNSLSLASLVRYPPRTSLRDCLRNDWNSRRKNQMSWILADNPNQEIEPAIQKEHCLSHVVNIKEEEEEQPTSSNGTKFESNKNRHQKQLEQGHHPPLRPLRQSLIHDTPPLHFVLAQNVHITNVDIVPGKRYMTVVRGATQDLIWRRQCFGATVQGYYYYMIINNKNNNKKTNCQCNQTVDRAFVVTNWWGNETGHFLGETLPRIASYLFLARQMPILLPGNRETSQMKAWLEYLNLTGMWGDNICARKAIIPSSNDCRGGEHMAPMLLATRRALLPSSSSTKNNYNKKSASLLRVVVMYRDGGDGSQYREPIRDVGHLQAALQQAGYPHVDIIRASNTTFWACVPCQLALWQETWLLIASHGAGIMNLQFLSAGSYVVEIASRGRPEEPIYSNVEQRAHVLGLHYYHYYWHENNNSNEERLRLNVPIFVQEVADFAPPPPPRSNTILLA